VKRNVGRTGQQLAELNDEQRAALALPANLAKASPTTGR
jgi:hypothetical protein